MTMASPGGSDLTEATEMLSENEEYREGFDRLVTIARRVMRDVVSQSEHREQR